MEEGTLCKANYHPLIHILFDKVRFYYFGPFELEHTYSVKMVLIRYSEFLPKSRNKRRMKGNSDSPPKGKDAMEKRDFPVPICQDTQGLLFSLF